MARIDTYKTFYSSERLAYDESTLMCGQWLTVAGWLVRDIEIMSLQN